MPGYVEATSHDVGCFRSWSREQLREIVDSLLVAKGRVQDGTLTAAKYAELETVVGLRFNPDGLLANAALAPHVDPVKSITYDWVHNMLQDGVFSSEVRAFMVAGSIDRGVLHDFLADERWRFPHFFAAKSKQLHRIFDERRISATESSKVKASCAEFLGVYGLLRHYVECVAPDTADLEPQRLSFFAVCRVLDLLVAAKEHVRRPTEVWHELQTATVEFLCLHKAAYGEAFLKPKHHWQLDVPAQLRRDQLVLDAFVVERTHLRIKAVADHVRNTTRFEASVLASACNVKWKTAGESVVSDGALLGPTAPLPSVPGALVADRLEIWGFEISFGDVVLRGEEVGVVAGCCAQAGSFWLFVQTCEVTRRMSGHSHVVRTTTGIQVWSPMEVRLALAWHRREDGSVLVVRR